jgi:hypothetical protein
LERQAHHETYLQGGYRGASEEDSVFEIWER